MVGEKLEIRLGAVSTISASRHTLRRQLDTWGCGNADDVLLVFSGLITNATLSTSGPSTAEVTHDPPDVRIEVHDSSHAAPQPGHDERPGGFGLRLVDSLSQSWGWEATATGKTVWSAMGCGH